MQFGFNYKTNRKKKSMNGKVKYKQSNKKKLHLSVFCYTLHKQKVCVLDHILMKFSHQKKWYHLSDKNLNIVA